MAGKGSTGAFLAAVVACVGLMQTALAATVRGEPFSLDDIVYGRFYPGKMQQVKWASGSVILDENDDGIGLMDVDSGKTRLIVPREVYDRIQPKEYWLSADHHYILLAYDVVKVFRHAAIARYVAYNIRDITENKETPIGDGERLQLVKWSPVGNALAYVLQNNLYYLPQVAGRPVWVTDDGAPDIIYNGVTCHWLDASLGAAESLTKDGDVYWSQGGKRLVFGRYDVSAVPTSKLLRYGRPGALDGQYPTVVSYRDARPGTPGPKVSAMLVTLPNGRDSSVIVQELMAPTDVLGEDSGPEDCVWADDRTVMLSWRNRVANVRQFVFYDANSDDNQILARKGPREEQKAGWLDHQVSHSKRRSIADFVTIGWEPQAGGGASFPQVVVVTETGRRAITTGAAAVTEIYGWANDGTVYYQATEEGLPSRRQVYAVREGFHPWCLSCDITIPEHKGCLRASASFSHDFSWYALSCLGPDPPSLLILWNPILKRAGSTVVRVSSRIKGIQTQLLEMQRPLRLDQWASVGDGLRAQVRLWVPPGLDLMGSEKRPAIVFVYAGPGFQLVDDSFDVGLNYYFTTWRRYVYVVIDGRGSGGRDNNTLFAVYRRLGSVEVDDQIAVTKWLTEKYGFIDGSRVGIWGMSYGGYAAAMAMARDDERVFRCAASVAPVTSWMYTDAVGTEMYMGLPTPEDNEAGYNASDVTRLADRFRDNAFFLLHGTDDDIVHYQHSMTLARALEEAGVLFRQQSYPGRDHTFAKAQSHLYRSVDEFFAECFEERPAPR